MAETCPQLSLCWAFACLVGQDNIFLKSLCVQEFNVWLSPRREYLLSCLCTSFCVLLCLCQSLMTPSATIRGKDSLFQELLSGPASPVGLLPAGMEALDCGFISLGTVCSFSAEAEQFWGSDLSQKTAEGFGHRAHWPQVGHFPPVCLYSADLFHSPEITYVANQS